MHALSTTTPPAIVPPTATGEEAHSPLHPHAATGANPADTGAIGGGWLALRLTGALHAVFLALGAGLPVVAVANAAMAARGRWF